MKKGCIIASIVIAVLIVICGVGAYIFRDQGNESLVVGVQKAIAEYQTKHPGAQIETSNEAWAAALTSEDAGISNAGMFKGLVRGGKLLDFYGHPFHFTANDDGSISVVSAGKDGQLGTEDDHPGGGGN